MKFGVGYVSTEGNLAIWQGSFLTLPGVKAMKNLGNPNCHIAFGSYVPVDFGNFFGNI